MYRTCFCIFEVVLYFSFVIVLNISVIKNGDHLAGTLDDNVDIYIHDELNLRSKVKQG